MLFTTIPFWASFIAFLLIYALLRKSTRTGMMIYVVLSSLLFFYLANGWLMLLLPATAIASYYITLWMSRTNGTGRKFLLFTTVAINLAPLLYYKYTNFSIELFNQILHTNFSPLTIALPIGISFYTFQAISYSTDIYRKRFTTRVSPLEYLFYISFFPLLLAGPITRAGHFFPQLRNHQPVSQRLLHLGLWLIITGLIKKAVIADYIAQYNNWIFDSPETYSGLENLMGVIGYTVQIHCDFSGYSDISIGLAAMMGIRLRDNFRFPYQAINLAEFWHRWHISLSTWFRDYLYIPLGGNRHGRLLTYFNNLLTMTVAGLWHGSTLMFVFWGAIHGLGLVIYKSLKQFLDHIPNTLPVRIVSWMLTFTFVAIAWIYFRSPDVATCGTILERITTDFDLAYLIPFVKARPAWTIMVFGALLIHSLRERTATRLQTRFILMPWILKLIIFTAAIQLVIEFHTSNVQPFIYYQF